MYAYAFTRWKSCHVPPCKERSMQSAQSERTKTTMVDWWYSHITMVVPAYPIYPGGPQEISKSKLAATLQCILTIPLPLYSPHNSNLQFAPLLQSSKSSLGFPRILLPCSCSWHLPSGWPVRCLSYSQQQQQMHREEEKAARPGDAAT